MPYEPDEADIAMLSDDKKSVLWAQVGADIEEIAAYQKHCVVAHELAQTHIFHLEARIEKLEAALTRASMATDKELRNIKEGCKQCFLESKGEGP